MSTSVSFHQHHQIKSQATQYVLIQAANTVVEIARSVSQRIWKQLDHSEPQLSQEINCI
jgi:hypothetical protein